jgi:hypothetical protein
MMTEGGTQMNFYSETFDRLGEVSGKDGIHPESTSTMDTRNQPLYNSSTHGPQDSSRAV